MAKHRVGLHTQTSVKGNIDWTRLSDIEKMEYMDNPDRPQADCGSIEQQQNLRLWFKHYKRGSKIIPEEALGVSRPHTDYPGD